MRLTVLRAHLLQSSVRKLARRTGYGEVFAVPDPAAAEAAVRARADAMADKLEARAQEEIGGLPFTSCADHWPDPHLDPGLRHRRIRDHSAFGLAA